MTAGGRHRDRAAAGLLLLACAAAGAGPEAAEPEAAWFADASEASKLDFVHQPGAGGDFYMPESIGPGAGLLDYDGDGDLDVYLVDGAAPNRLFRQAADGSFEDVTAASGLGDPGYGMGVAVGDVDNDGDPDVYVTNVGADALYRNRGDGTFAEATEAAGISNPEWGASAVFFDAEPDGDLDLYVANYVAFDAGAVCTDAAGRRDYCGPSGFAGVADRFFRNRGDGTFTDDSAPSGIAARPAKGLGVASVDLDGDGRPEIYVANDGEPNLLWTARGDGAYADRALELGAAVNALGRAEAGMGVAVGDADGDGAPDLFVSHLRAESNTLYRNAGEAGFEDATSAAGLAGRSVPFTGFGTGFADFDHDGALDLVVVNGRVTRGPLLTGTAPKSFWDDYAEPDQLWIGYGSGRFRLADAEAGALSRRVENGRGLALGDVDSDGDVDLLVAHGGGRARLLLNVAPARGSWAAVRPLAGAGGRDALGTAVAFEAGGRSFRRWSTTGSSFLSASEPRAHAGLGAAAVLDAIEIRWPGGARTRLTGLPIDRTFVLTGPR